MNSVWSKLETQVVNGAFPLQRCVGSTDHSGVFLTQSTPHAPSAVALKLIPFDPESAEEQLSKWRAAVELSHPHLLRMFEAGECSVAGQDYLYARMEYAEQTLAQVLEGRALTEDEVREMLVPTLGALEYLHQRNRVQGGLKPSNILVVGNLLKLASDTVSAIGEPDANVSTAADVHALGVTLCEALTRRRPSGLGGAGDAVLPPELPVSFRGLVARCLSRDPRDRPTVAQLQAWLRGEAPMVEPPTPAQKAATRLVVRVELPSMEGPTRAAVPQRTSWRVFPLLLGAVVLAAVGWIGYRLLSTASTSSQPIVAGAPPSVEASPTPAPPAPAPAVAVPKVTAPAATAPASEASRAQVAESNDASVNEVMPVVSQSSLDTIRGTLRVSVRVTLSKDGSVTTATSDDPGPSRYFERRSLEAAKKWTFAPADVEQRSMQLRFAFTRSGVTASVRPLD